MFQPIIKIKSLGPRNVSYVNEGIHWAYVSAWVALHKISSHLHTHNLSIGLDELYKHKQGNKCIYELFKFSAVPVIFFPSKLSVPHQETHWYAFWITRSFTVLNILYRWNDNRRTRFWPVWVSIEYLLWH